ncbi:MAG: PEP-CTERM sorting domain-containing protein, partial [Planctomycetota bacterium]
DLAVHNGTIAVNFRSDASFPPFNGIARFDSNGNPLSNFSIDDGPSSFGMWDIAFDADGNLHGIGVLNGGFADRIRVWGTDGMFSDINLDYTSAFGSNASAYQRRSPDLAVFSSTTAVPEPSSVLFIASGLGALAFRRGRRAIRNTP